MKTLLAAMTVLAVSTAQAATIHRCLGKGSIYFRIHTYYCGIGIGTSSGIFSKIEN